MPASIGGDDALHAVLAPVSVDAFIAEYWERQPLHVARNTPGFFADVYDVADIEEALVAGARDLERFALVRAGAPQAALDEYVVTSPAIRGASTGRPPTAHVDPRKVIALFERGYTLVIKDAALLSARLQRTCNRLQRDLCAYAGANVYFTPPGAQGFEIHHDSHDTLTIQIEGSKTWRIYEPVVELPLESQPLHGGTRLPPLTLHREVTLAAGDTLYLPRGYAHEAVADAARALHVTFALAPVRAIDLLHAILDTRAAGEVGLRRALPFGWQNDPAFAATFCAEIAAASAGIFAPETVAGASEVVLNGLFAASRSDAGGAFDQLAALAGLGPNSILRLNDALPLLLRERAQTVDLMLPGTSLGLPKLCMPALERLQAGPVRFGDLDLKLSERDRHLFVTSLLLAGILLIERPD